MPKSPKQHNRRRRKTDSTRAASRDASRRAFKALSHVKAGKSLAKAARLAHTTANTVLKYAGGALVKTERFYVAQRFDREPRRMKLMTPSGLTVETISGSRTASRIATYMSAVDHYLRTGDSSRLRAFAGKAIRVANKRFLFVTETRTLRRLAYANEISFEDLYGDTV